jgi:transcriptional regulator with XRE-family HTH domain
MQVQDRPRDLGRAVRQARRCRNMTQEALALESGLQRKTMHRIETGKSVPRIDTLERIAGAMDMPVAGLLGGEG